MVTVSNLEVSEQLLTGESVPVAKTTQTFKQEEMDLPIGDRLNLCYASTVVTKGRGTGIVIGTAMNTQVCVHFDSCFCRCYRHSTSLLSLSLLDRSYRASPWWHGLQRLRYAQRIFPGSHQGVDFN